MEFSRGKKLKLNIIMSLLGQAVTLICGLIVPRVLLQSFGSEQYGATASIAQFLSYITLFEGGICGVARAALYKPLAENNMKKISGVMAELRHFFNIIGCILIGYVLILACSFKYISHIECMDFVSTFLLVVVISISTFSQYFFGISNATLIQASQKNYITITVNMAGTVLNAAMIVLLTAQGYDIIIVKLASSIVFALKPIALWLYVNKKYKIDRKIKRDKQALSQKWTGLGQHLAFFLHSNTDVCVLTLFADLKLVAVYSVAYMIVANVQNVATSFITGMEALFGDMIAKNEDDKLKQTFDFYEVMISIIAIIMFGTTLVLIDPFIKIYTANINDANYYQPVFTAILTLSGLFYCFRTPYMAVVNAAGHYKQTRVGAYGEAAVNIVLSLILVKPLGLVGVAIGTVVATLFRWVYHVVYLSKRIVFRKISLFVKRFIVNVVTTSVIYIIGKILCGAFAIDNYIIWAMLGVVIVIVSGVLSVLINFLLYRDVTVLFIKKYLFRKKNNV